MEKTEIELFKQITNRLINSADLVKLQKMKDFLLQRSEFAIDKDGVEWFPVLVPGSLFDELS